MRAHNAGAAHTHNHRNGQPVPPSLPVEGQVYCEHCNQRHAASAALTEYHCNNCGCNFTGDKTGRIRCPECSRYAAKLDTPGRCPKCGAGVAHV